MARTKSDLRSIIGDTSETENEKEMEEEQDEKHGEEDASIVRMFRNPTTPKLILSARILLFHPLDFQLIHLWKDQRLL